MARLEHRIAEAADAWLTDPQDTGAYARLVAAVRARREHPRPAGRADADEQVLPTAEPAEDAAVQERPVVRLGAGLSSDPRTALEQLLGRRPDLQPPATDPEPGPS